MRSAHKNRKYIYSLVVLVLLIATLVMALPDNKLNVARKVKNTQKSKTQVPASFNKSAYPTDQASSLWAVVNKGRSLPQNYIPAGLITPNIPLYYSNTSPNMLLRHDTARAMENLFNGAKAAGYNLQLVSGYRSYSNQIDVYSGYVTKSGQAAADTFSARPGHSEHQTGLAADLGAVTAVCELDPCFGDTPEGKWLAQNSFKYGFIIRYQKDTQNITGYEYEPWHVRYVGIDLSTQLNKTNQTLEQFFNLPIYKDYSSQSLILKM